MTGPAPARPAAPVRADDSDGDTTAALAVTRGALRAILAHTPLGRHASPQECDAIRKVAQRAIDESAAAQEAPEPDEPDYEGRFRR